MQAFIVSEPGPAADRIRAVLTTAGYVCPLENVLPPDQAVVLFPREPELVVVSLAPDPDRASALMARLPVAAACPLIAVGPAADPRAVIQAMRAGASDFADEQTLEADLPAAVERIRARPGGRQTEPARTIVVFGPNGGSGASTVAANLAAALAAEHQATLLIDLKLHEGDLAALLDVQPKHDLAELCQNAAQMDRSMFERSLAREKGGVLLLAPPRAHADAALVTADGVRQVLNLARASYPYVVIDLDNTFAPEQVQALRQADVVVLVIRLDFACLRNARRALDQLDQLGVERDKVRVVANRCGQPREVAAAQAEEALGMKIGHSVPDDPRAVNRANNDGVPVVRESPSSHVSRSLVGLARSVNGRKAR